MKIAHIATSISMAQVVLGLMRLQKEQGHEVVALCPDDEWARPLKAEGIRVVDIPFRRHSLLSTLLAGIHVWAVCRRERFDVAHTHNSLPGVAGRIAAGLARVPAVVHTCHAWPLHQPRGLVFTWTYRALETIAARYAHAVLFQNPDDMASCITLKIVPPERATLIGNGIDVARFLARVSEGARPGIRRELGIHERAFVVVSVARLELPKGHEFLLRGLERLVERADREIVALFVGVGECEARLKAEAGKRGLQGVIRFTGYRDDIPDLLAAADVSALTSLFEGVPRALMESMASGLPVVATDVPGTRSLIRPGRTGLLVRHGDVEALAEALRHIMQDPVLAERLGETGKALVTTRFDERLVAERVRQVYETVLSGELKQLPHWDSWPGEGA